jgi:ABC-type branched-subunit amino acid transport system ATPase component
VGRAESAAAEARQRVERFLPTVRALARERDMAVILVGHNDDSALRVGDFVYVLNRGRVVLAGSADQIGNRLDLVESSHLGLTAEERSSANGRRLEGGPSA